METIRPAYKMLGIGALISLGALTIASGASHAQSWVDTRSGAAPGDSGPRIDAIVQRQILNIAQSPARLGKGGKVTYNHPSMLCLTQKGTLIFMWNGGPAEGTSENRIFFSRKEKDAKTWSDPKRLETRQIDFGSIYQPKKAGAPLMAGYWLGPPRASGSALIFSDDDGKTWSAPRGFPSTDDPFWAAAPAKGRLRFSMSPPVEFPDGTLWFASEQQHKVPAIVVVPPDNYTADPKGTPWKTIHSNGLEKGVHGDFLILSSDYQRLLFVMRGGGNYLTTDQGKTWKDVPGIPRGGAGVAALSLDVKGGPAQGWHLTAGSVNGRNGLGVRISKDPTNPSAYKQVLALHVDLPAEDADPSMIQTPDRMVHLLFTGRHSEVLKYYVIDPDKLIADAPPAKEPESWPAPATNLKARFEDGAMQLSWTANANNAKGYVVWRKLIQETAAMEKVAEVAGNVTSYKDASRLQKGRYSYWVQVFNEHQGRFSKAAVIMHPGSK